MKNDKQAEAVRSDGNKLYSEKKFFEALLKYNESLCTASAESENLGLAFANRSAVYSELKLYEKSLKNIELARSHNYPSKNIEVLEKREEKCRDLMKSKVQLADPWNFFKLSYKSNKKLPFAVDLLELRVDDKYGKHIVTKQDIKVGDVLLIESPVCSALISESRFIEVESSNKYQRCGNCMKDNILDLIPCPSCSCSEFRFFFIEIINFNQLF